MPDPIVYRPHAESPARAAFHAEGPEQAPGARSFEIVSRGDFVSGTLILPDAGSWPAPLVFVTLADGRSTSLVGAGFTAEWVASGFALASIDLPLHGLRSSPKLSERLQDGLGRLMSGGDLGLDTRALVEEFARQSTSDLLRGIEAMAALPEIDAGRIGMLGIGLGAITSGYALAAASTAVPAIAAGVLAFADATISDAALDPAAELARRTGRAPCAIQVQAIGDNRSEVAGSVAQRLYEAAPDPKQWASFAATDRGSNLPNDASRAAREFLCKALGL